MRQFGPSAWVPARQDRPTWTRPWEETGRRCSAKPEADPNPDMERQTILKNSARMNQRYVSISQRFGVQINSDHAVRLETRDCWSKTGSGLQKDWVCAWKWCGARYIPSNQTTLERCFMDEQTGRNHSCFFVSRPFPVPLNTASESLVPLRDEPFPKR